jgi:hypothetical protein
MTQQDRDRLVALQKAKKKLITQRQAAEEVGQTERHMGRLLVKLQRQGHPTGSWTQKPRPKSCDVEAGDLSRLWPHPGQRVPGQATPDQGQPGHRADMDDRKQRYGVRNRNGSRRGARRSRWCDLVMQAADNIVDHADQIQRLVPCLQPSALQPRVLAGVPLQCVAGAAYLETEFIPWWNLTLMVEAACDDDAHRPLDQSYSLAASLSYVDIRQVNNDYTIQFDNKIYQIARKDIRAGLRKSAVRVELRLDDSIACAYATAT